MAELSKERIRSTMQAVKGKGTKIELALAKALWSRGYRYVKNDSSIFGKPDFSFKLKKLAVFVDGEFWHGKDWNIRKFDHKTNKEFWFNKIEKNMLRDKIVNQRLKREGWTVLRFWGSDIEKRLDECVEKITVALK